MTGFHDYKHFNSVFKKMLNMTPSEYMNSSERIVFRPDPGSGKTEE